VCERGSTEHYLERQGSRCEEEESVVVVVVVVV
jgi:hypothetical protein